MNAPQQLGLALQEAEAAIKAVSDAADPDWKASALRAVLATCRERRNFISDDVWDAGLESTREDRALGPVMREAARLGYCRRTDRMRPSRRSHGSGKPVWESLMGGR